MAQRIPGPFRVFLGLVPTGYLDPALLARIVREGSAFCELGRELGRLGPSSLAVLRADLAGAGKGLGRYIHTHPEIVSVTIAELLAREPVGQVVVTGLSRPGFSTAAALREANGGAEAFRARGYYELERRFAGRVTVSALDELPAARYHLAKDETPAAEIVAPALFQEAGLVVYCPKLRSSVFTQGFSGAVDLGAVRACPDPGHDRHVRDMLEVCNPALIVSDGVVAAVGGSTLTQRGHELGAVLVANNALAHDWIAALILNLDPSKIDHLRIAAESGWGPASASQIDLGGAGSDGMRQLAQKSRFWDLGALSMRDFGARFERENPGLRFPLELLGEEPGALGQGLLDWLHLSYDTTQKRPSMARWPKGSVCVGMIDRPPAHRLVYALGGAAISSLARLTGSSVRIARSTKLGIDLSWRQLKQGSRHLVVCVPDGSSQGLTLGRLSLAFACGSLARIRGWLPWRAMLPSLFGRPRRAPLQSLPVAMTCRMRRNDWWALKPIARRSPSPLPGSGSREAPKPAP